MSDIKWIKITTDMFDNRKIKYLRRLPDGNNIVLIWIMLLTMAGRCNAGGMVFLTENFPYRPEDLANELDFDLNTVRLALEALVKLDMICTSGDSFSVVGWEEYQNIDGMERIREQTRKRVATHREKQKELCNVTRNVTVTSCNATDIDIEEDKELDINNTSDRSVIDSVMNKWNDIEGITKIYEIKRGSTREKRLLARLNEEGLSGVFKAMNMIAESDFLMGKTGDWKVTFDWFIRPSNFTKVIEGNYKNASRKKKSVGPAPNSVHEPGDKAKEQIERMQRLVRGM